MACTRFAHDLDPPRWKSSFEKRKGSMQETVEASGITPQPGLLITSQAQMGHLTNHFCSALFLSGNTQITSQGFARAMTLRRISEHALRVVFFPSSPQGADKVFPIAEVVIKR